MPLAILVFALILALAPQSVLAQERRPVSITLAGTALMYDAQPNTSGVGVGLRASVTFLRKPDARSQWRLEYGFHRLAALGQTCTTGFPAACFPESPPDRVHAAVAVAEFLVVRSAGIYALAGLGGYHRSATREHGNLVSPGSEVGLGVALGHLRRVRIEGRFARLFGARNQGASMWPLTVGFQVY